MLERFKTFFDVLVLRCFSLAVKSQSVYATHICCPATSVAVLALFIYLMVMVMIHYLAKLEYANNKNQLLYRIGGYVGLFAHPLYWFIWTYLLPGFYESASLRFLCCASAVPVLLFKWLPPKIKRYFPIYWFGMLMLQLPITFTYLTLMNNLTGAWLVCETMMVLVLAVFYANLFLYLLNLTLGVGIAIVLYLHQADQLIALNIDTFKLLVPLPMAIFCVIIFNYAIKRDYLLEKNETLRILGGSIAHEIRNPLNSILIAIEEIESMQNIDNPQGRQTLYLTHLCKESIKKGNNIIDITLKNLQGKPIDTSLFVPLSFKNVMQQALNTYAFRSGEKQRVIFHDDYDFNFIGDEALFSYTIFNLMKNALYYLSAYPQSLIEIKAYPINGKNLLCFKDTGPGIPAALQPRLFDGFTTFGKKGGTGLGLPFCRRVMESFGGSITCRSKPGEYTEFILSFPLTSQLPIAVAPSMISIDEKLKNKCVLLVDDDSTSMMIMRLFLSKKGILCDVAENGQQALALMAVKSYDAVFMDVQMPIMDGLEATRAIRSNPATANTLIIGLTGASSAEEIADVMQCGMNDCLTKPFNRDELLQKLSGFLG
jgi:hypothetical protein